MKHFDIWEWADFVRGLGDRGVRSRMQAHQSECPRCEKTAGTLRDIVAAARADADYDPPEHAVRYAKAVYALAAPEKVRLPRLIARLVHDSMREPLPAGIRAQDRVSRRALYEAGGYHLDLQLERQPASGLIVLVGQL